MVIPPPDQTKHLHLPVGDNYPAVVAYNNAAAIFRQTVGLQKVRALMMINYYTLQPMHFHLVQRLNLQIAILCDVIIDTFQSLTQVYFTEFEKGQSTIYTVANQLNGIYNATIQLQRELENIVPVHLPPDIDSPHWPDDLTDEDPT